jgi:TP901 family phage tail tape measure protein
MVNVESKLADINVIMNVTSRNLSKMSGALFDIARKTGQSFDAVAQSMTEFSRQGLGMEESLRRTRDALILSRLAGMDTVESTNALTAAVNSFSKAGLTTTQVVNKLAKVDAAFAVSSEDLANSLKRVGGSAQAAGVTFDQLLAATTALQERTARGGAVIGNSLKTIFTRIQRPDVLKQLDRMGIQVTTLRGEMIPTMSILKNMARAFDTLAASQKSQVSEMVGGVFQVSMLKSLMADLGQGVSQYDKALDQANSATSEAIKRNAELNKTLSARLNALQQVSAQTAAKVGDLALGPSADFLVGKLDSLMGGIQKSLSKDGYSAGRAFVTGIGDFLKGPGLMVIGFAMSKLIAHFAKDIMKSLSVVVQMGGQRQAQAELEAKISALYAEQTGLIAAMNQGLITEAQAHAEILAFLREQYVLQMKIKNLGVGGAGAMAAGGGLVKVKGKWTPTPSKYEGHIPAFNEGFIPDSVKKAEIMGALSSGYVPGKVKTTKMAGIGRVAYNSAEKIKSFPGLSQPAIMPPRHTNAGRKYSGKFKQVHGFTPYAGGAIPGSLHEQLLASMKAEMSRAGGSLSGGPTTGIRYGRVVNPAGGVAGTAGGTARLNRVMNIFAGRLDKIPITEMGREMDRFKSITGKLAKRYNIHSGQIQGITDVYRSQMKSEVPASAKRFGLDPGKAPKGWDQSGGGMMKAMMISMVAPMIGSAIKEHFKMGRQGESVTDMATQTASMGAMGHMLGGAKGGWIGALAGGGMGLMKVMSAFNDELPDFESKLADAARALQKFDEGVAVFTKKMNDYKEVLAGEKGPEGKDPKSVAARFALAARVKSEADVAMATTGFSSKQISQMGIMQKQGDIRGMERMSSKVRDRLAQDAAVAGAGFSLKELFEKPKDDKIERKQSFIDMAEMLGVSDVGGTTLMQTLNDPKIRSDVLKAVAALQRMGTFANVVGAGGDPSSYMARVMRAGTQMDSGDSAPIREMLSKPIQQIHRAFGNVEPMQQNVNQYAQGVINALIPSDDPKASKLRAELIEAIETSTGRFDESINITIAMKEVTDALFKWRRSIKDAQKDQDTYNDAAMDLRDVKTQIKSMNDSMRMFDISLKESATRLGLLSSARTNLRSTRFASGIAASGRHPITLAEGAQEQANQTARDSFEIDVQKHLNAFRQMFSGTGAKEFQAAMQDLTMPLGKGAGGRDTAATQQAELDRMGGRAAAFREAISAISDPSGEADDIKSAFEQVHKSLLGLATDTKDMGDKRIEMLKTKIDEGMVQFGSSVKMSSEKAGVAIQNAANNWAQAMNQAHAKMMVAFGGGIGSSLTGESSAARGMGFTGNQLTLDSNRPQRFKGKAAFQQLQALKQFGTNAGWTEGEWAANAGDAQAAAKSALVSQWQERLAGMGLQGEGLDRVADKQIKDFIQPVESIETKALGGMLDHLWHIRNDGVKIQNLKELADIIDPDRDKKPEVGKPPAARTSKEAAKELKTVRDKIYSSALGQKIAAASSASLQSRGKLTEADMLKGTVNLSQQMIQDTSLLLGSSTQTRRQGGASQGYWANGQFMIAGQPKDAEGRNLYSPERMKRGITGYNRPGMTGPKGEWLSGYIPPGLKKDPMTGQLISTNLPAASAPAQQAKTIAGLRYADILRQQTGAAKGELLDELKPPSITKRPGGATSSFGKSIFEGFFHGGDDMQTQVGRVKDTFADLANDLRGGFKGALRDAMFSADSLSDALRAAAVNILDTIASKIFSLSFDAMFNAMGDRIGGKLFGDTPTGAKGGYVTSSGIQRFAGGGMVRGGTGFRDDVPAMLSQGEFVIRRSAVSKYGSGTLTALNRQGGGGVSISAKNTLIPNDPKRPTSFEYDIDSRLSSRAVTDESRPDVKRRRQLADKIFRNAAQYAAAKAAFKAQQQGRLIQAYSSAAMMFAAHGLTGGRWDSGPAPSTGAQPNTGTMYGPNRGGFVGSPKGYASGGYVDSVPAMLMGGEFVVNRGAVNKHGRGFFEKINRSHFQDGGYVGGFQETSGSTGAVDVFDRLIESNDALKESIDESTIGKNKVQSGGGEGAATGSQATNTFNINVTVDKRGGVTSETEASNTSSGNKEQDADDERKANDLSESIRTTCLDVILNEKRPGGALSEDSATRPTAY